MNCTTTAAQSALTGVLLLLLTLLKNFEKGKP
jgi:hypothetical protein